MDSRGYRRYSGFLTFGSYTVRVILGSRIVFDHTTNGRHRHSFFETCLGLDGEGEFIHGADRYVVGSGDLFTATPGVNHEICSYGT